MSDVKKGDQIHLKNGHVGTVTQIYMGDFIGDPRTIEVQYVAGNMVHFEHLSETELKARQADDQRD